LPASAWVRVARLDRPDAAAVEAELGCSAPTARRVAALLGQTKPTRAATVEAKLQALLIASPLPPRRSDDRPPPQPQQLIERQMGTLTRSDKLVIDTLRRRVFGATVNTISALSGVSAGHARRCLRRIERLGWATSEDRSRLWGYRQLRLRVWRLTWNGDCAEMLAHLRPQPTKDHPCGFEDMVPPEFWFEFWSGTPADQLRVSTDGLLIAETLITGHNPAARLWALAEIPVDVLERCRQLRGCDSGAVAGHIDAAITSRCG
jgi:hypothetical protein